MRDVNVEEVVSTNDLRQALQNWATQREQVALLLQAVSLTLPAQSVLIHTLQGASRQDDAFLEKRFTELHLETVDRLAAELKELARSARHCQALRASYDQQQIRQASSIGRA